MKWEIEDIIVQKYQMVELIGKGKFGMVFSGIQIKTREPVAIKLESPNTSAKLLKHETMILNHLYNNGCRCVPSVHWYGIHEGFTTLVMDCYEMSLEDYLENNSLSLEKKNYLMTKMIEAVEKIHQHWVVHRDLKPSNFMIGSDRKLYLIDFGLSTFYVNEDKQHIPYLEGSLLHVIGTQRYMSYHVHCGEESVRRDDLISLGYIYLFLIFRRLPWEYYPTDFDGTPYPEIHVEHPKNKWLKERKEWENVNQLCENTENKLIQRYFKYCYQLPFSKDPNYEGLKKLFL
jgi:casein kinase 1